MVPIEKISYLDLTRSVILGQSDLRSGLDKPTPPFLDNVRVGTVGEDGRSDPLLGFAKETLEEVDGCSREEPRKGGQ